jgi:drug/metabolite transporter (DMT)-like permease
MKERPGTVTIVAAFALLCLIWGSTWAVIQIGLQGVPPFTGVSLRFLIAAALLLLLVRVQRVPLGKIRRERWLWLVNGTLAFSVSYGIVYWAEQWVPSGLTSVLFATYPLFVAILAHFILPQEALTRPEVIGSLIGFAGVAVIFSEDFALLGGRQVAVAAAVMLFSPLVSAVSSVLVKRWGAGVHPYSLSAVPMAMTAVIMGVLALSTERGRPVVWDAVSMSALLYLAIFGSAVTFSLYYWLLSQLPAKRLALIAYIIPLEAVLIGALRGEPFTAKTLMGSALVVGGVALAVHRFSSKR